MQICSKLKLDSPASEVYIHLDVISDEDMELKSKIK